VQHLQLKGELWLRLWLTAGKGASQIDAIGGNICLKCKLNQLNVVSCPASFLLPLLQTDALPQPPPPGVSMISRSPATTERDAVAASDSVFPSCTSRFRPTLPGVPPDTP
jgi:hypothetical protein